jgi:hypothetical protein
MRSKVASNDPSVFETLDWAMEKTRGAQAA